MTSMGGRLLRALAAAAAAGARAHPGSARRRRGARVPLDRAREAARHAEGHPRHRAPGGARVARHRGSARSRRAAAVDCRRAARAAAARGAAGAARPQPVAELDDLADLRDELESNAGRRAAGGRPRRRHDSRRRRRRSSTSSATISRSGKQHIAEMEEAERARTGISSLEDPLQPRVRVLHRDLEVEPRRTFRPTTTASRRLPAANASSRRR